MLNQSKLTRFCQIWQTFFFSKYRTCELISTPETSETTPISTDKPVPTKNVSEPTPTPKPELACTTKFHPFHPWEVLISGIVYIYIYIY